MSTPYEAFVSKWGGVRMSQWQDPYQRYRQPMLQGQAHYQDPRARPYMPTYRYVMPSPQIPQATDDEDSGDDDGKHVSFVDESVQGGDALDALMTSAIPVEDSAAEVVEDKKADSTGDKTAEVIKDEETESAPPAASGTVPEVVDTTLASTTIAAPEIVTETKTADVETDTKPKDAEQTSIIEASPAAEQSVNVEQDPVSEVIPESAAGFDDTAEPAGDAVVVGKADDADALQVPETDDVIAEPISTSEVVESIPEPALEQSSPPANVEEKAVEPPPVDAAVEETPVADVIQEGSSSKVDVPPEADMLVTNSTPAIDLPSPPLPIGVVLDDIPPPPPPTTEQMLSIDVSTPAPPQEPMPETPIVDNASIAGSLDSEDKHVSFAPGTPEPKPTKRKKKTKDVKKGKRRLSVTDAEGIPANLAISNANLDVIPVPPPAPEVAALSTVAEGKDEVAAETQAKPASEVKAKTSDQRKTSSKAKAAKTGGLLAGAFFMAKSSKSKSKSAKSKDSKKESKTESSTKAVAAETGAKTDAAPAGLGIELAGDESTAKDVKSADKPAATPDREVVVPEDDIVVVSGGVGAESAEPEIVVVPEKQVENSEENDTVVVSMPESADAPVLESTIESAKEPDIAESPQPDVPEVSQSNKDTAVKDDKSVAVEATMTEGENKPDQESPEASADAEEAAIVEVKPSETVSEGKDEAEIDEDHSKEQMNEHVEETSADAAADCDAAEIVDSEIPAQNDLNKKVTEFDSINAAQSDDAVSPVDSGVVLHETSDNPREVVEEADQQLQASPEASNADEVSKGESPADGDEVAVEAESQKHQTAEEQLVTPETRATGDAQSDEPQTAKADNIAIDVEQPQVPEEKTVSSIEDEIVAEPSEEMSKEHEPTSLVEDAAEAVVDEGNVDQSNAAETETKDSGQAVEVESDDVVPDTAIEIEKPEDDPQPAEVTDLADKLTEASIEDVVVVEESKNDGSVEITVVEPANILDKASATNDADDPTTSPILDVKVDDDLDKTSENDTNANEARDGPGDHEVKSAKVASEDSESSDQSKIVEDKPPSTSVADAVSADVEPPPTNSDSSPLCTEESDAKAGDIEAPSTNDASHVEAEAEQHDANADNSVEEQPDTAVIPNQIEGYVTADEKPDTAAVSESVEVQPVHVTEEKIPATAVLDFAPKEASKDVSAQQPPSPTASKSSRSRKTHESSSRSYRKKVSEDDPPRISHSSEKDRAMRSEDRRRRRSSVIQEDAVAKERRRDIRRTRDRASFVEEDDDELRRLKREARRAERRVAEAEEQARLAREAHEAAELRRKELQKIAEEKKRPSTRDGTSKRDDTISSRAVKPSSKSHSPLSVRTDLDDRDKRSREDERAKPSRDDDRSRRTKDDDRSRRSRDDDRSRRSKESTSDSRSQRKETVRDDKRSPETTSPTASRIASSETSSRRHRRRSDAVESRRGEERSERGSSRKVVDLHDRPRTEPKRQSILGSLFGR